MGIRWSETVKEALRFGVSPKRWLPLFIVDFGCMVVMFLYLMSNMAVIGALMTMMAEQNPMILFSFINMLAVPLIVGAIWGILRLWVMGALIHQSVKPNEYAKSFRLCCSRYGSLLVASIITGIIMMAAGWVPLIGGLLNIFFALIFLFVLQGVMVDRKGFAEAIGSSWNIFRKWPVRVFIMWVIISIITWAITAVFMAPVMLFMVSTMLPYMAADSAAALFMMIATLMSNMVILAALGAVFMVGASITGAFSLKALTDFYRQIK
jgi:hypothetical protein